MFDTAALGEADKTTCHGEQLARYGYPTFYVPQSEVCEERPDELVPGEEQDTFNTAMALFERGQPACQRTATGTALFKRRAAGRDHGDTVARACA
ncbi:hypothetical protein [Nocardiopsis algeriensis]|uniref:Uncharacterized protein n=1 Tax=Nocardiopsis algeriensis TaxID=1478215 RepID=A0A841ITM1_9ACTN|nr:hypothetical protein [Nocardiopsis algeriensis]MBB6122259.1 hypothetical protein [Nocardiopsis algeriensis]